MKKLHTYVISMLALVAAVNSCTVEEPVEELSGYDLALSTDVTDMLDPETKATLLNSGSTIPGNSLKLYGWQGTTYWMDAVTATYSSGSWTVPGSHKIYRSQDYSYLAYANLPASGASIETPTTKNGEITYTVTNIANAQSDVLLGRYSVSKPENGNINLKFSHPYASVRIKYGNATGVGTITGVSLTGVYSQGKTRFSQSSTESSGVMQYSWTGKDKANNTLSATGLSKTEGQDIATFLVIPQDLTAANVILTITSSTGGTMTQMLNQGSWTPGYTTTYTIQRIGTVDITINDKTVTNSGESKVYVRATITGAWYDSNGNVTAPWKSTDGTFTSLPGSGWTSSGDYYYYSTGLASGASTSALFASYSTHSMPIAGAPRLKLDILVQAIPYNVNKTCQQAFEAL